jgi:hypothetical protein
MASEFQPYLDQKTLWGTDAGLLILWSGADNSDEHGG